MKHLSWNTEEIKWLELYKCKPRTSYTVESDRSGNKLLDRAKSWSEILKIRIERESQDLLSHHRHKTWIINLRLLNKHQNGSCLQTLTPGSDSDNIYERKRLIFTFVNSFYQGSGILLKQMFSLGWEGFRCFRSDGMRIRWILNSFRYSGWSWRRVVCRAV